MAYEVSQSMRDAYERDGVVCLRKVIAPEVCDAMLQAADAFVARGNEHIHQLRDSEDEKSPRFTAAAFMSVSDPAFRQFACDSVLPVVAAQLMEADTVRLFYDQLFMKDVGSQAPTPWHNDLPFWPMEGNDLVSMWVALTPVSKATSGVEYLAGSHKPGILYQPVAPGGVTRPVTNGEKPCPDYLDPALRTADQRFLSWDMEPGDVLCHHPLVAHGASGNASVSQRRAAISIRYLGKDVAWHPRPGAMPILPHPPAVEPGDYPADDTVFPVIHGAARMITA